jgi:L-iditol 2-dehydrogenase
MKFAEGALLETLGVALHAVDLGHVRLGQRVAVLGAGPIGLCIAQVARLCGATVYVAEPLAWRLELAQKLGATPLGNPPGPIDIVFEAAWAGAAVQQAAELCRPGGRVVLVGIPTDDRLELSHSVARRKGLTLVLCRRMKHTYPQAIDLVSRRAVDVTALISHHFLLAQAPEAFALNAAYTPGIAKVIIDV